MLHPRLLAVIAAGGMLGALGRLGVGEMLGGLAHGAALATLTVNVVGSLVIGVLATALPSAGDAWWHRPFWITGVLGGFTTFSAYALETGRLLDDDLPVWAAGYLMITVVAGLLAARLGVALVRPAP